MNSDLSDADRTAATANRDPPDVNRDLGVGESDLTNVSSDLPNANSNSSHVVNGFLLSLLMHSRKLKTISNLR